MHLNNILYKKLYYNFNIIKLDVCNQNYFQDHSKQLKMVEQSLRNQIILIQFINSLFINRFYIQLSKYSEGCMNSIGDHIHSLQAVIGHLQKAVQFKNFYEKNGKIQASIYILKQMQRVLNIMSIGKYLQSYSLRMGEVSKICQFYNKTFEPVRKYFDKGNSESVNKCFNFWGTLEHFVLYKSYEKNLGVSQQYLKPAQQDNQKLKQKIKQYQAQIQQSKKLRNALKDIIEIHPKKPRNPLPLYNQIINSQPKNYLSQQHEIILKPIRAQLQSIKDLEVKILKVLGIDKRPQQLLGTTSQKCHLLFEQVQQKITAASQIQLTQDKIQALKWAQTKILLGDVQIKDYPYVNQLPLKVVKAVLKPLIDDHQRVTKLYNKLKELTLYNKTYYSSKYDSGTEMFLQIAQKAKKQLGQITSIIMARQTFKSGSDETVWNTTELLRFLKQRQQGQISNQKQQKLSQGNKSLNLNYKNQGRANLVTKEDIQAKKVLDATNQIRTVMRQQIIKEILDVGKMEWKQFVVKFDTSGQTKNQKKVEKSVTQDIISKVLSQTASIFGLPTNLTLCQFLNVCTKNQKLIDFVGSKRNKINQPLAFSKSGIASGYKSQRFQTKQQEKYIQNLKQQIKANQQKIQQLKQQLKQSKNDKLKIEQIYIEYKQQNEKRIKDCVNKMVPEHKNKFRPITLQVAVDKLIDTIQSQRSKVIDKTNQIKQFMESLNDLQNSSKIQTFEDIYAFFKQFIIKNKQTRQFIVKIRQNLQQIAQKIMKQNSCNVKLKAIYPQIKRQDESNQQAIRQLIKFVNQYLLNNNRVIDDKQNKIQFSSKMFSSSENQNFIISKLQQYLNFDIQQYKVIYLSSQNKTASFVTQCLQKCPNTLILIKTKLGHTIACFSSLSYCQTMDMRTRASVMISSFSKQTYPLKANCKPVQKSADYIIFGNKTITIKKEFDNKMTFMFEKHTVFQNKYNHSAEQVIGQNVKQIEIQGFQIYQIAFKKSQIIQLLPAKKDSNQDKIPIIAKQERPGVMQMNMVKLNKSNDTHSRGQQPLDLMRAKSSTKQLIQQKQMREDVQTYKKSIVQMKKKIQELTAQLSELKKFKLDTTQTRPKTQSLKTGIYPTDNRFSTIRESRSQYEPTIQLKSADQNLYNQLKLLKKKCLIAEQQTESTKKRLQQSEESVQKLNTQLEQLQLQINSKNQIIKLGSQSLQTLKAQKQQIQLNLKACKQKLEKVTIQLQNKVLQQQSSKLAQYEIKRAQNNLHLPSQKQAQEEKFQHLGHQQQHNISISEKYQTQHKEVQKEAFLKRQHELLQIIQNLKLEVQTFKAKSLHTKQQQEIQNCSQQRIYRQPIQQIIANQIMPSLTFEVQIRCKQQVFDALEKNIIKANQIVNKLREKQAKYKGLISVSEQKLKQLQQALEEKNIQMTRAELQLYNLKDKLKQINNSKEQLQKLKKQKDNAKLQTQKQQKQLIKMKEAVEKQKKNVENARGNIAALLESRKKIDAEYNSKFKLVNDMAEKDRQLQQKLNAIQKQLQSKQKAKEQLDDFMKRMDQKIKQSEELSQIISKLKPEITQLQYEESQKRNQIDELNQQLTNLKEKKFKEQQLNKNFYDLQNKYNQKQNELRKIEQSLKQIRQNYQKQKDMYAEAISKRQHQQKINQQKLKIYKKQSEQLIKQFSKLEGAFIQKKKQFLSIGGYPNRFFVGQIIDDELDRQYILDELLKLYPKRTIAKTKLLFSFPLMVDVDPHRLVDSYPCYIILMKMCNTAKNGLNYIMAMYSEMSLLQNKSQTNTRKGFVSSVTNRRSFYLKNESQNNPRLTVYNQFYFVFGNDQMRFKLNTNLLETTIGHLYRSLNTPLDMKNPQIFTGSPQSSAEFLGYEIYQILFDQK